MMKELKNTIRKIIALLEEGGDFVYVDALQNILNESEESIWQYLESNEVWGSAGSLADQGLFENKELRPKLEDLIVELGEFQQKEGRVNSRTESTIQVFRNWKEERVI